ncbi:zinc-dependent peptidase [Psychroserpens mesophilus]|uniref:zinc-dependent peptidase n=1 Tax=Psychroserpens mesophilus TaxID=325473 RepID=UPI003D650A88
MPNFLVIVLQQRHELSPENEFAFDVLTYALIIISISFILLKLFYFFEMAYVEHVKKQLFYNHIYIYKKSLQTDYKKFLKKNFRFYDRLPDKQKTYFEHRVSRLLKDKEFIGKNMAITDEMKILIAATQTKLTFGLRDYRINSVKRIIFYPKEFYSYTNKAYHKGEFNLEYKALVFSWKDVIHGYDIKDDNINLAVHEFIHAIHFYYISARKRSTSAAIFIDSYYELKETLDRDTALKNKLITSKYLRDYAYTNQFEFLAVVIESFIETPKELKSQFPEIYEKVKEMLNFNFAGY